MKHISWLLTPLRLLTLLVIASLSLPARAQTPDWHWGRQGRGTDASIGQTTATDANGNVFVTGDFQGSVAFGPTTLTSPATTNTFLTKYDSTGRVLWAKRAGGFQAVRATALGVDKPGNVYVSGNFQGVADFDGTRLTAIGTNSTDIFIVKYSTAGTLLWIRQVGNDELGEAIVAGCADPNGGIYLAGWFQGDWRNAPNNQYVLNFGSLAATIPALQDSSVNMGALFW